MAFPSAVSFQTSWRLPTGGSGGEYAALYAKYNSNALIRGTSGPNFVLTGFRQDNGTNNQNIAGYYWSNSAESISRSYHFDFDTENVTPANQYPKYAGFSVRLNLQKINISDIL